MFSFESYGVFETTSKWFRMTVEIFVRIVSTVFDKIKKSSQMAVPWSILASLEFQPYDVDLIAHIGPPHGVKWLEKVSFESLRQFLTKLEKFTNGLPWSISAVS